MATVASINVTPVKSLGLVHPDEVELTERGVPENRRFYLVGADGRLFNGIQHGPLVQVRPQVENGRISLAFPDGEVVAGEVGLGAAVETNFYGRPVRGRLVEGPWAEALSAYVGKPVRVVKSESPGDACDVFVGTIVSRASCERLGAELGAVVDPRRFRMLFELEGVRPHEEDGWEGRLVRAGEAVLRVGGPVPRCAITTQDPETGVPTLDTLRGIKSYRGVVDGKRINFGVYAEVEQPGRVRVGDPVEPL